MATFGDLVVNLGLNSNPFTKGIGKARSTLGSFSSGLGTAAGKVLSFAGAITGVAGTAGVALLTKNAMSNIDAVAKMSDTLGIATEQLTGLHHAASLGGASADEMNTALVMMSKSISGASQGFGAGVRAFDDLGLSAENLVSMRPEEQMGVLADALMGVENQTDKVRIATELFGRSGAKLLPVLQNGSAGLKDMVADAAKLGITFNRVDAAKVEQANDAVERMKQAFGGLFNTLAINIAPTITAIANHISEFGSLVGEVARNWESYWKMTANNASIFVIESLADIASAFSGVFAAGKTAFDGIFQYAVARFSQVGALLNEQVEKWKGNDVNAMGFRLAASGFDASARVIGDSIAGETTKAFDAESSKVQDIFRDAAASLRSENVDLASGIAVAEAKRLEALSLPGTAGAAALSASSKNVTPEGILAGSREALDKIANLRNRSSQSDPQAQTARNTQRMATGISEMARELAALNRGDPVVIGGFT
ncbi:MAG: hypothetical protein KDA75_04040 [Planctomycetaceae bacterium]|nr:hypothetical protein [Planctomycetaceae bacterium]